MDNYPPGVPGSTPRQVVDLECPECGHRWETVVVLDMGTWTWEEGKDCPVCGHEGKECFA